MKILVTGAKGFLGKNLIAELKNKNVAEILEYDRNTGPDVLSEHTKECRFVFHLAGVNRPQQESEFMDGNYGFSSTLLKALKKNKNQCPVLITSSIQATRDNPYGRSKKAAEELMRAYERGTGAKVLLYRLPNVFGKWCRPNYNSAVATFCHNVANELPVTVHDPDTVISLVYIDDVIREFLKAFSGLAEPKDGFYTIPEVYPRRLGDIVSLIDSFHAGRKDLSIPDLSDEFTRKLYSTYLSYLPEGGFRYPLRMNVDQRGSFTECFRTPDRGQVSVNHAKPGVTKGNHWHHSKNEKFLVVSGSAIIRFRKIGSDQVTEYPVSEERMEVVEIPPGYTHSITNTGMSDLVTVMWASEPFDPDFPDTYYMEV